MPIPLPVTRADMKNPHISIISSRKMHRYGWKFRQIRAHIAVNILAAVKTSPRTWILVQNWMRYSQFHENHRNWVYFTHFSTIFHILGRIFGRQTHACRRYGSSQVTLAFFYILELGKDLQQWIQAKNMRKWVEMAQFISKPCDFPTKPVDTVVTVVTCSDV